MAYINVVEWRTDQVTDWLKGLDDNMYKYVFSFTNNEVGGRQLLNIRPYELEQLGMHIIGHQEIVLEAVENLRNFHYNLDKDNLQFMALHVATFSHYLHRQLSARCEGKQNIETQLLHDITRTIATIKPLIAWLEGTPFRGNIIFSETCKNMLSLALELATCAQRDRFVECPAEKIKVAAEKLERVANYVIQDITDPMLLQPASLNLVTLKKRESELGFNVETSYQGIHRITDIKYNSPAHTSGKIEDGDEIIQINYQTVVGWQYKTVLMQLRDSPPDVLLTLKKRPKHTKIYGQIYMQPYRLPSKKRAIATRWGENLPSPRAGFLTVPESAFQLPNSLKANEERITAASSDSDSSCSDISTPTDAKPTKKDPRIYYRKPKTIMLQRRNTICGDDLIRLKCVGPQWQERKIGIEPVSPSLRDKSISFGFGLEITRPTTCIGISNGAAGLFAEGKIQRPTAAEMQLSEGMSTTQKENAKPGVSKVVRFDASMKYEDYPVNEKYTCNVDNTILETFEPIPFVDEEDEDAMETLRNTSENAADIIESLEKVTRSISEPLAEAMNFPVITRRGRLDKSHSTPAYDNSGEESEIAPAVEPRKEFLQTPPVPPRPRKPKDIEPLQVPTPPPKPLALMTQQSISVSPIAEEKFDISQASCSNFAIQPKMLEVPTLSELHTPTKSRTLTLKKKHSLVAKRRNINIKLLGMGEIQGHLYRRTKDRRGVTFWARLYFVMLDTILYGFRSKEAVKASCVIFLPGFTVSLAKEVHSKPWAFKVYHSAKTFYFAAESQDALNQWVEYIRQSTIEMPSTSSSAHKRDLRNEEVNAKDLFSETDSSGDENESMIAKNLSTPSPQANKDVSTSFLSKSSSNVGNSNTKQDRRYLGSLRKLTKGSLHFKSSSPASSDIPVPTEQYRSYRKVPGGSFGIQIGANTPGYGVDASTLLIQNSMSTGLQQLSESRSSITTTADSLSSLCLGPPSSPAPIPQPPIIASPVAETPPTSLDSTLKSPSGNDSLESSPSKSLKKIPFNFLHASNPNLVEFDFQTSKTLDYALPKINSSNAWDAPQPFQGCVTLKDLMLQKQKEESQEMYNNRVLLGVEKTEEFKRQAQRKAAEELKISQDGSRNKNTQGNGAKLSKTQNRSLPKTPDYEISFKPDDENIKRTRTKEGLKLRDFGYELISGDEPLGGSSGGGGVGITTSRQNSNTSNSSSDQHHHEHHNWAAVKSGQFLMSHKAKKHSSSSVGDAGSTTESLKSNSSGSFKKKGKLEAFKTSSERLFQFNKHSSSSSSGMTMTLPLNKHKGGSGIKKSHTYNNDLKEKAAAKYESQRKNSAPMFSKLLSSSSSSTATNSNNAKGSKEKRLLGSPLLHRTLFGSQQGNFNANSNNTTTYTGREYDQEIFSQVILPNVPSHHHAHTHSHYTPQQQHFSNNNNNSSTSASNEFAYSKYRNVASSNANITAPDVEAPKPPEREPLNVSSSRINSNASSTVATPEYPNMECPPVFEPEIYSLNDPNASSLSILLRKNTTGAGGTGGNTPSSESH